MVMMVSSNSNSSGDSCGGGSSSSGGSSHSSNRSGGNSCSGSIQYFELLLVQLGLQYTKIVPRYLITNSRFICW